MKRFLIIVGILLVLIVVWFVITGHLKRHPDFTGSTETSIKDAYYVRAYRHNAYIIEHKGHRLAAKCRESRSWIDGEDKPYRLMDDNDCTYMADKIGEYIGDDLMLQFGTELHLCPWIGVKTVQTADILDITDDELISESRF